MITALTSLKAISRPDGFFDRFSCAMSLKSICYGYFRLSFPFSSCGVDSRGESSHCSRCGLIVQREAGYFPFFWVQLRGMSALSWWTRCWFRSIPHWLITPPPLFMSVIISMAIIFLNSVLSPLAVLVTLESQTLLGIFLLVLSWSYCLQR